MKWVQRFFEAATPPAAPVLLFTEELDAESRADLEKAGIVALELEGEEEIKTLTAIDLANRLVTWATESIKQQFAAAAHFSINTDLPKKLFDLAEGDYDKLVRVGHILDGLLENHAGLVPVVEGAPTPVDPPKGTDRFETAETFHALEATFDDKAMKAVVTIIKPGTSLNNRHYTEAAIKSGYQLFEKAKMYVNHPPKKESAGPRDLNHLASAVRRTWVDEDSGSMKGEVKFFRKDFYDFVKEAREDIGVSINALCAGQQGVMVDGKKVDLIEAFVRANSVDWVTDPGAGGGVDAILEADYSYTREEQMTLLTDVTLEDLKKERPDLVTKITEETKVTEIQAELDETKTKLQATEEKVAQAETLEKVRSIVNGEERLPDKSKERLISTFEGRTVEAEKLEGEVKTAVDAELEYIGSLGVKVGQPTPATSTKPTVIQNVGENANGKTTVAATEGDPQTVTLNSMLDSSLGIQAPAK